MYRFLLRMPHHLREQLKASADRSGRSLNAELVYRLERSIARDAGMYARLRSLLIISRRTRLAWACRPRRRCLRPDCGGTRRRDAPQQLVQSDGRTRARRLGGGGRALACAEGEARGRAEVLARRDAVRGG